MFIISRGDRQPFREVPAPVKVPVNDQFLVWSTDSAVAYRNLK